MADYSIYSMKIHTKAAGVFEVVAVLFILSIAAATSMTNLQNAFATTEVYSAKLSGDKEVPPVNTSATGTVGFKQPHFNAMQYGIQVSNLSNVTGAHIHQGKVGENGPVIVTLFKADNNTGTGLINGQFRVGNITNDMLEGPMKGKFVEADLAKAMQNGEVYLNIHTTENPNGAIRGQIGGGPR